MKSSNALKSTRHSLGISVEGMARALGVSGETVRRWERGDPPGTVLLICDMAADIPVVAERLVRLGVSRPRGRPRLGEAERG